MLTAGLSEIVLIVADVRMSARFYEEVVGLVPAVEASDEWAWFFTGPGDPLPQVALHRGKLLFEEHSPLPAGERFGRVHYAFKMPRANLQQALANVRAHGVELYGPIEFERPVPAQSYYFYDPDGNLLEFFSPDA